MNDTKESPTIKVIEELIDNGAEIKVYASCKILRTRLGEFYSEKIL